MVVTGESSGIVRAWDPETGHQIRRPVRCIGESPQLAIVYQRHGPVVVAGSWSGIHVVDLNTGDILWHVNTGIGTPFAFKWVTVDRGSFLLAADRSAVFAYDTETWQLICEPFFTSPPHVAGAPCAVDMAYIAGRPVVVEASETSYGRSIWVWDFDMGDLHDAPYQPIRVQVNAAAVYGRDGRAVVVTVAHSLHVWDLETGMLLVKRRLAGRLAEALIVATSGGHQVVIYADNPTLMGKPCISVSSADDYRPIATLRGHSGRIRSLDVMSFQGRQVLISASWDGSVLLWWLD